jgi:release factor glutamine methyltransferase
MSLPTPSLGHLTREDYAHVYEPAEDTFLFLDALEADREAISHAGPRCCVEVGTGSGTVITFLAQLLAAQGAAEGVELLATDINPRAVDAARRTCARNGVGERVEVVQTDLVEGLWDRVAGRVDVLLFNPPYVVTPSEEVGGTDITASWAGGLHGREVSDRLFPLVPQLLSAQGRFYMIVLAQNKRKGTPQDIELAVEGFTARYVLERRAGIEHLAVICYTRSA